MNSVKCHFHLSPTGIWESVSASKDSYILLHEINFCYKSSTYTKNHPHLLQATHNTMIVNTFEFLCKKLLWIDFLDSYKIILNQNHALLWWKYRTKSIFTPPHIFFKIIFCQHIKNWNDRVCGSGALTNSQKTVEWITESPFLQMYNITRNIL